MSDNQELPPKPKRTAKRKDPRGQNGRHFADDNLQAAKHGLFAATFEQAAGRVYSMAAGRTPAELAYEAATALIGRVYAAYEIDTRLEEAAGAMPRILRKAVEAGQISPEAAQRALRRINQPDLEALGRALGPLKGLLQLAEDERKRLAAEQAGQKAAGGLIITPAKTSEGTWGVEVRASEGAES